MSTADRIIRTIIAGLFLVLYFTGAVTGFLGILLLVIAVIFLLTSLVGTCLIYQILGISTRHTDKPGMHGA